MRARVWAGLGVTALAAVTALVVLLLWGQAPTHVAPSPTPPPTIPVTEETVSVITPLPAPSPTPVPVVYTVQEGDTLGAIAQTYGVTVDELVAANGLADPDVLRVGQRLIIPVESPPPAPTDLHPDPSPEPAFVPVITLTPAPTLTPSGPPLIEIGQVLGSGTIATEVVIVRNRGGAASLEGWTLSGAEGIAFRFPALTLFDGAEVRVHTAWGTTTPTDLYWGRTEAAWRGGELITLRDAAGNVVDTYIVP